MNAPVPVLSFDGEFIAAPKQRFEETVVFVPFFGGKKIQLKRHSEFIKELGYNQVLFDLKFNVDQKLVSPQTGFGLRHIWADQIEKILNEVPGRKIVYAFSNPSTGAIEAIARRQALDIAGLICDSGPSVHLLKSITKYYKYEVPIRTAPLRLLASVFGTLALFGADFWKGSIDDLRHLPADFPVLSIRGWKDPLIPPDDIDEVFESHSQLRLTRLSLPKGGHLNGLKDFREEYVPVVESFLKSISQKI